MSNPQAEDLHTSSCRESPLPRLAPELPFPPYAFVGGQFPHPTRDAAGYGFGTTPVPCACPDPEAWRSCRPYLFGIDLFNHGYYWEAHEAWECLWHACDRKGLTGDFMRGLIRLAAAGVKVREGRPIGVRRHAAAAEALFRLTADRLGANRPHYMGLPLPELCGFAADIAQGRHTLSATRGARVEIVFDFFLRPE